MLNPLQTDGGVRRTARIMTWSAIALGLAAAVLGSLPGYLAFATPLLFLSIGLVAAAAYLVGTRPPATERHHEPDDERFVRELVTHSYSLGLYLVFLVLILVEALTIPTTLGYLKFFGAFAITVIEFFPAVLFGLIAFLSAAFLHHVKAPGSEPLTPRRRVFAYTSLGALGVFGVLALLVQLGLPGLNPERAVFVLATGVVALFFFVHTWTRMPGYDEITRWMETEERLRNSNLLRNVGLVFVSLTGLSLLVVLVSATGVIPRVTGLVGLGTAMVLMIPATFSMGVRRWVVKLHEADSDFAETRKRNRVVLNAASIALAALGSALAITTFLAFLAQVGGVAIFRSLLDVFVDNYPVILGLSTFPIVAAVVLRMRFESEEEYSDSRKAVTLFTALFTVVLAFVGIFIGSGMAEGTGIQLENAVLAMAGAVISLTVLVKSRALYPSVFSLMKKAIDQSADADKDLRENIRQRMIVTYVAGLLFIVGFVGYLAATSLGVVPSPGEGLATDVAFFAYILIGLALLVLVVVRYFQGVNIDPRWKKKTDNAGIGKKRLTAEELHRYIILGFSISMAVILASLGVLVQVGVFEGDAPPAPEGDDAPPPDEGFSLKKRYATDFFVFALLIGLGPYGFFYTREAKRIEAIDQKFPEFLRDLAESQRAGMTLTEAVVTAAKGNYGMLTPEIRKMAAQIEWGISFSDALQRFSKRVRTPLISRTTSLIVEAANAGGTVVDVLSAAANDSREIQLILKERKGSMAIYTMIIYVAFLVFMGVVAILNAQFIPEVAKAVSKAEGVTIGGLKFRKIDEQAFRTVFFHAAIIQALGGGMVAGVMEGGKPVLGLKHAFIMISLAYVIFRFLIGG